MTLDNLTDAFCVFRHFCDNCPVCVRLCPDHQRPYVRCDDNIGVPCACLIATFYLWQKETDAHKEEMKNMTDALNNNIYVSRET